MKWEYQIIDEGTFRSVADEQAQLNSLGQQGWELIAVLQLVSDRHIYLKRRIMG